MRHIHGLMLTILACAVCVMSLVDAAQAATEHHRALLVSEPFTQKDLLLQADDENQITFKHQGLEWEPEFSIGRIVEAGIGLPEWRILYRDTRTSEIKVFGVESTGTVSSVRAERGSHFEGFIDKDPEPFFRLNSWPKMQIEFGEGGTEKTDVAIQRSEAGQMSFFSRDQVMMKIGEAGVTVQAPEKRAADTSDTLESVTSTQDAPMAVLQVKGSDAKAPLQSWSADESSDSEQNLQVDAQGDLIYRRYNRFSRPKAGTPGRVIFNDDDHNLNIDTGDYWILPNGQRSN